MGNIRSIVFDIFIERTLVFNVLSLVYYNYVLLCCITLIKTSDKCWILAWDEVISFNLNVGIAVQRGGVKRQGQLKFQSKWYNLFDALDSSNGEKDSRSSIKYRFSTRWNKLAHSNRAKLFSYAQKQNLHNRISLIPHLYKMRRKAISTWKITEPKITEKLSWNDLGERKTSEEKLPRPVSLKRTPFHSNYATTWELYLFRRKQHIYHLATNQQHILHLHGPANRI